MSGSSVAQDSSWTNSSSVASSSTNVRDAKEMTVDNGRVIVKFPGDPKATLKVVDGVPQKEWKVQNADGTVYEVCCYETPTEEAANLDVAGKTYAASRSATILEEKVVTVSKHRGKEVVTRLPNGAVSRARLWNAKGRRYQVVMEGPMEKVTSPDANTLFASFKVRDE